jgi:prevent-host-death family protein
VSAAEAKARLSELVASVAYAGERVVIERRGKPMAAIVGLGDLAKLERNELVPGRPRGALALVGAWPEVRNKDIDEMVNRIYSERRRSKGRTVHLAD